AVNEERLDEDGQALKAALLFRIGEVDGAVELLDVLTSVRIDSWASAQLTNVRGNIALAEQDYESALEHFRRAEVKWRYLDKNRQVGELVNIGVVYDWIGAQNFDQAVTAFERALIVAEEVGANRIEKLRALYNWVVCLAEHGLMEKALEREREAERLIEVMQAKKEYVPNIFRLHHLISLGITFLEKGELEPARELLRRASHVAAASGNLALQGMALFHLGELNEDVTEVEYGLELLEHSGSEKDLAEYRERFERLSKA
ncbi:MAG: tetratricopeptide repeat protein, partial [Trueperaceae bacterium]